MEGYYLTLFYQHRMISALKMPGTGESYFNVSFSCEGKVTRQVSTNQNY